MSEKFLIIGLGFLGNTIFQQVTKFSIKPFGTHKSDLDICNIESIEKKIDKIKPDCIINCAALTNLDQIESNPKNAYAINAYGAKNLAIVSLKKKIKLIHISTDSVFDGKIGSYKEEDLPNPINKYAKSKKMGEDLVKEISEKHVIVRTNFYGNNQDGKFLFNWIMKNLQQKIPITGFHDVIFNPLEIENLSSMIIELVHSNFFGTIHLSSNQPMSKYEFATTIARKLNYDTDLVRKGSIKEANFIAQRPLNTSLSNLLARKILKTLPLSLEDWLDTKFDKSAFSIT
jgi:dTDP-4-dehydrorhamnose reductase